MILSNGLLSSPCQPNAGGAEPGVTYTRELHGLIVLHILEGSFKDELVQILPDTGEVLAVIEMSKECVIGSKIPILGKVFVRDSGGNAGFLTSEVVHVAEVGTELTEVWAISKTAEHFATILGKANVFLSGAHTGLKFSGDPA